MSLAVSAVSGCYRHYGKTYSLLEKPSRPDNGTKNVPRGPPVPDIKSFRFSLQLLVMETCGPIERVAHGAHVILVHAKGDKVALAYASEADGRVTAAHDFLAEEDESMIILVEGRKFAKRRANRLSRPPLPTKARIPCRPSGASIKPPELPKPGSYLRSTR